MKNYLFTLLKACIAALVLPLCFILVIIILLGVASLLLIGAVVIPIVAIIAGLAGFDVAEITIS